MGLFDKIIGTSVTNSEDPTPFVLEVDEKEAFVPFEATGGGGGGTGTGSGTGNGNGSGGGSGSGSGQGDGTGNGSGQGDGTGNGSGQGDGTGGNRSSWGFDGDRKEVNQDAFAHIIEPELIKAVEEPADINIDIGGDMSDLISGVTLGEDTTIDNPMIIESVPETEIVITPDVVIMPEIVISGNEPESEPIIVDSLLESMDDSTHIDENTDLPIASPAIMPTLDDRISGFVADLEALKADDEMLLHEKETAIEKLETEMKNLEKEVKKIQADEKKIDLTIASLNNTPKLK